jgi:hypothetical protein
MRDVVRSTSHQVARDLTLVALSLVSVAIGLYQLSRGRETPAFGTLDAIDLAIVAVFWIDLVREGSRVGWRKYLRTHWWELPSLVPAVPVLVANAPAVAVARALRLLRIFRIIGVLLRLRPIGEYLYRLARRARIDLILGMGACVIGIGTVIAYAVESEANPNMTTWGQATWFAFNMFTNVAYLDLHPITISGRILAGILQLCGIAFIGIFTASLAGAIVHEGPPAGKDSSS